MNVRPLHDRVLIKRIEEKETVKGGIIIPDSDNEFHAQTEEYADMISAGILDPAKVTRSALQNAASIASLMLTTVALVVDIAERDSGMAMPAGGPSMY